MTHLTGQQPFYYYVLKGYTNILADERDKKKLLDIVLGILQEYGFELYAFCITNEEVCLMLGAADQAEIDKGVRQLIAEFCSWRVKGLKNTSDEQSAEELTVEQIKKLRTEQEVRLQCREIHCIPLSRNYVAQIKDYWWSSYQAYLGYYDWKQVNCSEILQMFSDNIVTARRQFRRFHNLYK